ncbi:MAG: hypothetical protein ACYTF7_09760 [Planctomycetota bacterium]|jgi:hypothetical protein
MSVTTTPELLEGIDPHTEHDDERALVAPGSDYDDDDVFEDDDDLDDEFFDDDDDDDEFLDDEDDDDVFEFEEDEDD